MERSKPLLRRRSKAYLIEFLEKFRHSELDRIIDKLELDENLKSLTKTRKAEAIIESVLYNPAFLLELLRILFKNRFLDDQIQEIKRALELSGITFIEEGNYLFGRKVKDVVFIGYDIQILERTTENLLEALLPGEVHEKLKEAMEEYCFGRFNNVPSKCRITLTKFARSKGAEGGNEYKILIDSLRDKGKIRESEGKLLKKIFDYLSSFEDLHPGKPPTKEQAHYMIMITQYTLLFLAQLLSSK